MASVILASFSFSLLKEQSNFIIFYILEDVLFCHKILLENLEDWAIFLSLNPLEVLLLNPPDPVTESENQLIRSIFAMWFSYSFSWTNFS
jgi:hypothetical protein